MDSKLVRYRILKGGIILIALLFLVRLYSVQIIDGKYFQDRGDRQYVQRGGAMFNRGYIGFEDKGGNIVAAATLKSGFILAINPKILKNPDSAYRAIATLYPTSKEQFFEKASKKDDPYEELDRHLTREVGEKIGALNIEGVILEKEQWRYYPGRRLGAHTLGFVGFSDGTALSGRYGLERYYNDVLSRNEEDAYTNFFARIFSNIEETLQRKDMVGEGDVIATIEPTVEEYIRTELEKTLSLYQATEGGAIVMNPKNGEIYAMVALPDFDPNTFNEEKNVAVYGNPLVENVYEMGSIIKPLTMAAGIDTQAVTAKTKYTDAGSLTLDGKKISNYDGRGRGEVDMQRVLNESLNTGAAFVVAKMGKDSFADYFRKYGLGEETGIDLPNEARGLIKNLESPREVEYATASFGQGIALTPIATVRALSALGNGGFLVTPHVVKEIRYNFGVSRKLSYGEGKRVLKKESSEEISRMLTAVVDEALAKGRIKREHYSVAAKTGTAQVAKEGSGGYEEGRFMHSFFGYFPSYDPKFIIFLYIRFPQNANFASETLTDPFSHIVEFLINYYQVPPDR